MKSLEWHVVVRLLAAGMCVVLLTVLSVSGPEPAIWSPYAGIQFLLLSAGLPLWSAGLVALATLYVAVWDVVARGREGGWRHITAALGVLTACSVAYFIVRLPDGLAHEGSSHVIAMIAMNAAGLLACWMSWFVWKNRLTVMRSVALVVFVCCWLFWCAFPYMGEGI